MKRKVLAMLVPALLVAGAANAAEIYNKDGNKVDFYGKMVGERIWSNTDDNNSENEDTSGNDSNLLIVFYVQIMPDDFVMQLHRF
ncbi:outer membrane protein N [Escherichia coli H489]|nr:hypothetical protein [Escherichia coli]EGB57606.1 outer membrane protein N [Escherichia coli H489]